jgi:GNAT superfamily N-acetyltransferase
MTVTIVAANSAEHFSQFAELIDEYFLWLRERYSGMPGIIDRIAGAQTLDAELATLADRYSMPNGRTYIVLVDGKVAAAGAWRHMDREACEMKRVFVRGGFRGHGIARTLCQTLIDSARACGYTIMRLDTGALLTEAQALYLTMGFVPCTPYQSYPPDILELLVFMEMSLGHAEDHQSESR